MTIEPGVAWGEPASRWRPDRAPVAGSDAELAALAATAVARGEHLVAGVGPGDVLRTLGVTAPRPAREQLAFSFDLGFVSLDGAAPVPFVAHTCAHRRWWSGQFAVVMNGAWVGDWYLGPRAHPNDGLLDVTYGSLTLQQRLQARRRVRLGTHLPHPDLKVSRRAEWELDLGAGVPVHADGRRLGRAQHLRVTLRPDCFTLIA